LPRLKAAIDNKNMSRFLPDFNLYSLCTQGAQEPLRGNLWIKMFYPVLSKQDHTAQFDGFIYNSRVMLQPEKYEPAARPVTALPFSKTRRTV
jgi:hypothetical protein